MKTIDIWTETLPVQFRWDPRNPVRGTEEFYVRTAECLAARGHKVRVIHEGPGCTVNGVDYFGRDQSMVRNWDRWRGDVVIYCNDPIEQDPTDIVHGAPKRIRWTNKYGEVRTPQHDVYDHCVVISEFQRSLFGDAVVIGHGCDWRPLYNSDGNWTYPTKTVRGLPDTAFFSSSPDRGLDFLRSFWPRVQAATGVELIWTDGKMSNDMVNHHYATARYWVHPGLGVELFCLSALKAQAAGCIPLVVPHMALAETVKYGLKTSLDRFERDVIEFVKSDPKPEPFVAPTWAEVTAKFEELF